MTAPVVFAANWKMHHGPAAARAYAMRFAALVPPDPRREPWLFVPAVSLAAVTGALRDRPDIRVGAQHLHWEARGAFTGELPAAMLAEAGATGVLVGHSERRHLFGLTDEQAGRSVAAAVAAGLVAVLCVGETLAERERDETMAVVERQLGAGLAATPALKPARLRIAYEPVWAIGTGRTATPDDAAAVHAGVRAALAARGLAEVPVLYGGSVNAGNVAALLARDGIDGVLVGGASLDADGWAAIVTSGG